MNKSDQSKKTFLTQEYIVGIGASAGGLEAIHELFDNMPPDTNFSFVIVQHLSPDYKSLMPELLAKHTSMQVFEAKDEMVIQPNCIYVIPSKKIITISGGKLRLAEKLTAQVPNHAIDAFFSSLAAEKGKQAIGIILSGTGTDGTKGIEAIKNRGGVVIVQDPITARFDGMPNSAIATGYADLILAPEMIAEELSEFLKETPLLKAFNELNSKDEALIRDILELVRKSTTHDFTYYKRPTINRRLAKRMVQRNIKSLPDYLQYLHANPDEIKLLCKEFLIGVTKFFRDAEAFEELQRNVIPAICSNKKPADTVKAWVVACSSGEEAYSLAILFKEHLDKTNNQHLVVKIFASDIDKEALDTASKGIYPDTIAHDISAERIDKFFIRDGNKLKVIPAIRKMVVFAQHDILKDPPFSKLDLITCRNMLIYMSAVLQKAVLKTFHFALNNGSYLFLGPSENIGILKDYMKETSKKWKIYKNADSARMLEYEPVFSPLDKKMLTQFQGSNRLKNALNNLPDIFKDTVIEEYKYAGIYIDKDFEVKQAIGNFNSFISFPKDKFNFNLLKLVSPELAIAIGTCVRKAIKDNERTSAKKIKIKDGNVTRHINIVVKPYLQQHEYLQPFLFIVLSEEESEIKLQKKTSYEDDVITSAERMEELEEELKETKENLQSVIEELETANEELQSSNEEMISANEELQSTNEELQSLNEELHTVNAEHQLKIKELIELNDDLNNYFSNTEIGQLLIDKKMIIRKFTPATTKQINLIPSDIGRSITDISHNFKDVDFINDIKLVMKTASHIEKEAVLNDGTIYQMKISPYVKQDKTYEGVVITFIDITEISKLNSIIEGVFNSSLSGIVALRALRNEDNKITDFEWLASNKAAETIIGFKPGTITNSASIKQTPSFLNELFNHYVNVVQTGNNLHFEYYHVQKGMWFEIVAVKMQDGIVITFTDITDKKHASDLLAKGYEELKVTSNKLMETNHELEKSNYDLMQFASVVSHDLKEPLRKIQIYGSRLKSKASEDLNQEELNCLAVMINSSNRMQNLIEDLLSFSKLSNKNVFFSKVNINDILMRILDDLEITIKEKKARFNIKPLPLIEAIPLQLHQLFQNLISNALKFNNSPEPYISISQVKLSAAEIAELGIDAKKYISICVEDNGIGFENAYKEKIFGIFQRLHGNGSYNGTGIGLAICKKIADNHHGFITAESEVNKGSKFIITLPLHQD